MPFRFYYPDEIAPSVVLDLPGEAFPIEREVYHWDKISVAEDGTVKGTDRGVTERFYILKLGPLTKEQMDSLENFLVETVGFRVRTFRWLDIDGTFRTVRFWDTKLKKVEKFLNRFYVTIKLREEITDGGIPPT